MTSILVHRYRFLLAACTTAALAASSPALLAEAELSLDIPTVSALGASRPTPALADDGKDVKETKEITPPEPSPWFNLLLNSEFANEYVTPRGMIVASQGLTYQQLVLMFVNLYKGEGFINSIQMVGGTWWDFSSAPVSSHGPYGSYPKTGFVEMDPLGGFATTFAKNWKLETMYQGFIMNVLDIGPSHHFWAKLTLDDTDYLHAFALNPYFMYWQELDNKATDADLPYQIFGAAASNGAHPNPGGSFYLEVGIAPSYTFAALGNLKLELPMRLMLPDNRFYGEYYKNSPTIGIGLYEVGGKLSLPLAFMPKKAGSWSIHAGARYMNFVNDNLYYLNEFNGPGEPTRYTWQIYGGISVFF